MLGRPLNQKKKKKSLQISSPNFREELVEFDV